MYRDGERNQMGTPVTDDLEPYRRLIELQKEMIKLSQKHAHTKREHDRLRAQVAREVSRLIRRRASFSTRLRQSTTRVITRLPGFAWLPLALKPTNPKPS